MTRRMLFGQPGVAQLYAEPLLNAKATETCRVSRELRQCENAEALRRTSFARSSSRFSRSRGLEALGHRSTTSDASRQWRPPAPSARRYSGGA